VTSRRPARIGPLIAELRAVRGLTQVELARTIGVNRITIGRWEAGRTLPSLAHLLALSGALRVRPEVWVVLPTTGVERWLEE